MKARRLKKGISMNQEAKYRVVLLDKDGYDIGQRTAENLKEAKQEMAYMLSDAYARIAETTHEATRTHKVEVRNAKGECVLDDFYRPAAPTIQSRNAGIGL